MGKKKKKIKNVLQFSVLREIQRKKNILKNEDGDGSNIQEKSALSNTRLSHMKMEEVSRWSNFYLIFFFFMIKLWV